MDLQELDSRVRSLLVRIHSIPVTELLNPFQRTFLDLAIDVLPTLISRARDEAADNERLRTEVLDLTIQVSIATQLRETLEAAVRDFDSPGDPPPIR